MLNSDWIKVRRSLSIHSSYVTCSAAKQVCIGQVNLSFKPEKGNALGQGLSWAFIVPTGYIPACDAIANSLL